LQTFIHPQSDRSKAVADEPACLSGVSPLNYRHAFHAGNFADLMKHAILLQVLAQRPAETPLTVVDTHAGAGLYDLGGEAAAKSGEAALGVGRLMADPATPPEFAPLKAAIEAVNGGGPLRLYPGSPWLTVQALAPGDAYVGCELRPDDYGVLAREIPRVATAKRVCATPLQRDGYLEVAARLKASDTPLLLLIDPPFERGDEYAEVLETLAGLRRRRAASALVWLPLKDLETFDAFLRGLDALGLPDAAVAEVRLRPLSNPMRMNGCALIMIGVPDVVAQAVAICGWVATNAGEEGSRGGVCDLDGANLAKS
jgi:23S rRNA (adenine2030-N6)-methyltransferase